MIFNEDLFLKEYSELKSKSDKFLKKYKEFNKKEKAFRFTSYVTTFVSLNVNYIFKHFNKTSEEVYRDFPTLTNFT